MAKKRLNKTVQNQEENLGDFLEQITPFVEALAPRIVEYQKVREPIMKRWQLINFTVMMTVLLTVGILAYYGKIDGSAATGLIGAVIGYVFGGLYQQKNK